MPLDVVVTGAAGFVGVVVARYLARSVRAGAPDKVGQGS